MGGGGFATLQLTMPPDKLYFHAKSAAVPPGKGVHEQVADEAAYAALWTSAPRWRAALCDTWESHFQFEGGGRTSFDSVDHVMKLAWQLLAFRAAEARGELPELHRMSFRIFCVEHNRSHIMSFPWLRMEPADQAMWEAEKEELRAAAQFAKFSQVAALRAVLLGTGEAELWELRSRGQKPAERAWSLEKVRKALREGRTELPAAEEEDADSDSETDAAEDEAGTNPPYVNVSFIERRI